MSVPGSRGAAQRFLGLVAAYVAVTAAMAAPYLNFAHFGRATYGGDAQLNIWFLAWANHAVLHGLPLFDSNLFFPAPDSLRYNEHAFAISLFSLPWAAAGASPVLAYTVTWCASFVLNGLAAYALLRRFVQTALAAFLGSLVFAYSFYVMLHAHGHLQLIWAWGLPASVLLLMRWFDRPTVPGIAAWAAVLVLQMLASWYLAVMAVVVTTVAVLVLLASAGDAAHDAPHQRIAPVSGPWRQRFVQMLGGAVFVVACVYPFASHYQGLRASEAEAAAESATLSSYWVPPANTVEGRWWLGHVDARPGSIWGEQSLYLGWLAIALGVVGVTRLSRRQGSRRAWLFPAIAVTGFLLSLGPTPALLGGSALAPFHWLSVLPGVGGMRAPARFAVLVTLGTSGLVAIGAEALLRAGGAKARLLLCLVAPLMLAEWFVVDFPGGTPAPFDVPAIYRTPEVRRARALVSLPDYRGTAEWYREGDYVAYSTAHWRPIVNGYGRAEPPGHADLIAIVRRFPATASTIRALGVQYVVVHADRFADGAATMLADARASAGCRLVARIGSDYLFELVAPQQ